MQTQHNMPMITREVLNKTIRNTFNFRYWSHPCCNRRGGEKARFI